MQTDDPKSEAEIITLRRSEVFSKLVDSKAVDRVTSLQVFPANGKLRLAVLVTLHGETQRRLFKDEVMTSAEIFLIADKLIDAHERAHSADAKEMQRWRDALHACKPTFDAKGISLYYGA